VVLEYWSVGVLEKAKFQDSGSRSLSITPLLHPSITPTDFSKDQVISGGYPKNYIL
jgi:hypothetical protein